MKPITILHLYPNELNCYGDYGNVLAIKKRLEWRGFEVVVEYHHPGKNFSYQPDIIVGGGGQDSGQFEVYEDLLKIGDKLHQLADDNTPMLAVCGTYQLFGRSFVVAGGRTLDGIGIFNAETVAGSKRLVGNIRIETPYGDLIGFENHSGRTELLEGQEPLGKVKDGFGNGAQRTTEGAIYKQVHGTYMHGSLLPRNPAFADVLLAAAVKRAYGAEQALTPLDDSVASMAFRTALKRF